MERGWGETRVSAGAWSIVDGGVGVGTVTSADLSVQHIVRGCDASAAIARSTPALSAPGSLSVEAGARRVVVVGALSLRVERGRSLLLLHSVAVERRDGGDGFVEVGVGRSLLGLLRPTRLARHPSSSLRRAERREGGWRRCARLAEYAATRQARQRERDRAAENRLFSSTISGNPLTPRPADTLRTVTVFRNRRGTPGARTKRRETSNERLGSLSQGKLNNPESAPTTPCGSQVIRRVSSIDWGLVGSRSEI